MSDPDRTFTAAQAAQANTALRAALDLPPEAFPVAQFVAMISDEIDQLRAAGKDDATIARLVRESTGGTLTADDIGRHYARPEARGWAGGWTGPRWTLSVKGKPVGKGGRDLEAEPLKVGLVPDVVAPISA